MKTIVAPDQSLLDIAMQTYGSAADAVRIAIANDVPVTSYPEVLSMVETGEVTPNLVASFYASRATRPITRPEKPQQLFDSGLFEPNLFT